MSLIYCNNFSQKKHQQIIRAIVEADSLFIYCVGNNYPDLEECVINELCDKHKGFTDDTPGLPITFSDNALKEAFIFCCDTAFHESKPIDELVIVDLNETGLTTDEIKEYFMQ